MPKNNILLIGSPIEKERAVKTAFLPGHVLELSGAELQKQSAAGIVDAPKYIANIDRGGNKGIDDAWSVGDQASFFIAKSGNSFVCRVAASAPKIVVGDSLAFKGDGNLKKTTTVAETIAVALEEVDNSGNSASDAKIQVEFI